jgi:hypothetical protein
MSVARVTVDFMVERGSKPTSDQALIDAVLDNLSPSWGEGCRFLAWRVTHLNGTARMTQQEFVDWVGGTDLYQSEPATSLRDLPQELDELERRVLDLERGREDDRELARRRAGNDW